MNLLIFSEHSSAKASFIAKVKEYLEPEGIVFPPCGSTSHYYKHTDYNLNASNAIYLRQGLFIMWHSEALILFAFELLVYSDVLIESRHAFLQCRFYGANICMYNALKIP